jgi:hypothetical protein
MRLSWKDGLATVLVAVAVVAFAVWSAGASIAGISGRGLVVAIFLLGIAGCYTAQSHFETVYGANGTTRPPVAYVVLVSAVGALATVAGVVALIVGGGLAVTTLLLAMIAMWILATVRHQLPTHARRPAAAGR